MQKWGQSQDLVHDETFSAGPCGDVNAGYSGEAWQGENCSKMIWAPLALWFCVSGLQEKCDQSSRFKTHLFGAVWCPHHQIWMSFGAQGGAWHGMGMS